MKPIARTLLVIPFILWNLGGPGCTEGRKTETTESASKPATSAPVGDAPSFDGAFKHEIAFDKARSVVRVELLVAPGFHAYTTGETVGRPLELTLAEDSDYVASGPVEYPKGSSKDLPLGKSVIVEGSAQIVAPVRLREHAATGRAKGTLKYQICTESACDRPRTVTFDLAA